jgi:uroporphyrin-III C-methyltransferase
MNDQPHIQAEPLAPPATAKPEAAVPLSEPAAPAAAAASSAPPASAAAAAAAHAAAHAPVYLPVASAPASNERGLIVAVAILALLLGVQWYSSQAEIRSLREAVANRLQQGDASNIETRAIAKSLQETNRDWQSKVTQLENKQLEAQSQQLALEQLYQDLSKNRDEWALAEIEQVISTASQQLQLAGNVQGAIIALQNADRTLSRSDKPQFITIRRAIANDIEKLKSLPLLDLTGIAVRLDSVIGQIDSLPLLSDEKPPQPVSQPKKPLRILPRAATKQNTPEPVQSASWLQNLEDTMQRWSHETWLDVRQLVQVRTVDRPDALLMTPTQAFYVRENVKLRLLNARLALLSRNESAFRSDMIAAQEGITKFFDTRAKQTQTAQAFLKQVQGSNLAIEMPNLSASLDAVRNYKAKP